MGMAQDPRSTVYEKYAADLVRFATGLAGPDDAQDLVSSAVVKAMWSPSWEQVVNPRAYLYQAVLNEAKGSYRKSMRRQAAEARAAMTSNRGTEGPSASFVDPEILEAVGELSPRQRAVVFLAYWEDLRPVEIARRLGLGESTVHRHLDRAERRLRGMIHA